MEAIKIWRFEEAPEELRKKSNNGGDEDWVALIPEEYLLKNGDFIPWMQEGGPFGYCFVDYHYLENGDCVVIGSHS